MCLRSLHSSDYYEKKRLLVWKRVDIASNIEKMDHQHLCQIFQIIPSTALWPVWSYSTKLIQCIYIVNLCSKILTDNLLRTRMKLHELSPDAGFVPPQHCVCSRMSSHTHAWSHGNITRSHTKRRKCVTLERWKRSCSFFFLPSTPLSLFSPFVAFVFSFSAFPSFLADLQQTPPPPSTSPHSFPALARG